LPLLLLASCAAPAPRAPDPAQLAAASVVAVASSTGGRCRATGSAVHLGEGRFLTVAHVVDGSSQMLRGGCPAVTPALSLTLGGASLPATLAGSGRYRIDPVIGQRYFGAEDLALLTPQRPAPAPPAASICATTPPPGTPVVLVTGGQALRTRVTRLAPEPEAQFGAYLEIPVQLEPGASGGALFEAATGCLAGLVSHRDEDGGPPRARLVPAATIHQFVGRRFVGS